MPILRKIFYRLLQLSVITFVTIIGSCCEDDSPKEEIEILPTFEVNCNVLAPSNYTDIFFPSEVIGYITNESGGIYKTIDGGNSWTLLNSNTDDLVDDIFFLNENEGYIVGGQDGKGVILKTVNGGEEWTLRTFTVEKGLNSVYFIDSNNGFCVGENILLKTMDGGDSWNVVPLSSYYINHHIDFFDEKIGFISGSKTLKTVDGGNTWNAIDQDPTGEIFILNDKVGFIYNFGESQLYKSDNKGLSWTKISSIYGAFAVYFLDEQKGFAVGQRYYAQGGVLPTGIIYYTSDGGKTWVEREMGPSKFYSLNSISFTSSGVGFSVGNTVSGCVLQVTLSH